MSAAKPAPDRRAILGGSLALASAVAASAAPAVAGAAPHPDAELLRLVLAIVAAAARMTELSDQSYEAEESRFREPPVPEALIWRGTDHHVFGFAPPHLDKKTVDGREQYTFTALDTLDYLRGELANREARGIANSFRGAARVDRLRELIAAGEAWRAERTAAWEAAGIGELDRAYVQESERRDVLALQIAALPARTSEGVCAKMRAITAIDCWNVEALRDHILPRRLIEADAEEAGETVLLSAMIDAARIGTANTPAAVEAA